MKMLLRYLLVVISMLACLSQAQAFTLSGTVYGGSSPLAGATVTLIDANNGNVLQTATSSTVGSYEFTLGDGNYNLLLSAPLNSGYASGPANGISVFGQNVVRDIVLLAGAKKLSGVIYGAGTSPLPNVKVNLVPAGGSTNGNNTVLASTTTNGQGRYGFDVAPGNYKLNLEHYGAAWGGVTLPTAEPNTRWRAYSLGTVSVVGDTTNDVQLPFVKLSGQIVDASGGPVANVALKSVWSFTSWTDSSNISHPVFIDGESTGTSDANGNYSIVLHLNDSSLTLTPPVDSGLDAKVVVISISSDTVRNLTIQSADSLSGVIYGAGGTPLPNVKVNLVPAGGSTNGNNTVLATTSTDAQGRYEFGVTPGSYKLNLEHYGAAWGGTTLPAAEPNTRWQAFSLGEVTVAGHISNDVRLPFVKLSGQIVDASGGPVADVALKSVWNFRSWTDSSNISHSVLIDGESTATSDANGNYSIVVHLDDASLTLTPPAGSDMNAKVVAINISSDTVQNLSLQSADSLSGVIFGAGGTPLPNVSVKLLQTYGGAVLAAMTTNGQGRYGFGVAPGSYILNLEHYGAPWGGVTLPAAEPSRYWRAFGIGEASVAGNTVGDVHLPFVTLSAKVTDANGVAVGNVKIDNTLTSSSVSIDGESSSTSDVNGNAALVVAVTANEIAINPLSNSGFGITNLSGLNVTTNKAINIVLPFKDVELPIILSGPTIRVISATSAVVEWQTNEPARGTVKVGSIIATSVNLSTTPSVLINGLTASTAYTAEVSVVDATGNGPTTASVTFTTASLPDTTPPLIINGPTVSALTQNSAVVEWETNEPATTLISGDRSATVSGYAVLHRVELGGLAAQTAYTLNVNSADVSGNGPTVRALTFTTLAATDTTPPVITKGPWAVDVTTDAATILWETDEPANSGVSYNDGTAYGVLNDDALTRQHSVRMTGLSASTPYNVTASSKDAFANGPTLSPVFTLKTLTTADTEAPVFVDAPQVCNINHQLIHLCFRTDEPASVVVQYGLTPDSLTKTEARPQLIQHHSLPINGLVAGATYYLRVVVRDQAGNERTSDLITATTTGAASASNPQFTHPPTVSYQGKDRVVVEWETDRPCNALVEYGVGDYDLQISNGKFQTKHKMVITNLQPGTSYQFRVKVIDVDGNSAIGGL